MHSQEKKKNVACSVILLSSKGSISSLVQYSYLLILSSDNADFLMLSC